MPKPPVIYNRLERSSNNDLPFDDIHSQELGACGCSFALQSSISIVLRNSRRSRIVSAFQGYLQVICCSIPSCFGLGFVPQRGPGTPKWLPWVFSCGSCLSGYWTGVDFNSGTYKTYNAQFIRKQPVVNQANRYAVTSNVSDSMQFIHSKMQLNRQVHGI